MITKDFILEYFYKDGIINKSRCAENYLRKHNLYDELMSYYNDSLSIRETIFRIINDLDTRPKCKICGKTLEFKNGGFATYCCAKCRNNDPEVKLKNSEGVSKSLTKLYQDKGNEIKEKRSNTIKEKYGVKCISPFGVKDIRDKAKETIRERYGVDNIFILDEFRNSRENSQRLSIELQKEYGYNIEYVIDNDEYKIKVFNGCPIHGDIIVPISVFNNRTKPERRNNTELCLICNPLRNQESGIERKIKNILDKLNVEYIQHNKKILGNKRELDFYLPEYKIAIECNGIYWHSGEISKNNHIWKYNRCKELGIRLIYLWEDTIYNETDKVENYLKSILGKNKKIFARNCQIKEITNKESKEFLQKYHLQGNVNATIRIGLFYNNELMQVITLGKYRKCVNSKHVNNEYELYRFCTKGVYSVVCGVSKLLKYFINSYKPSKIISYASKDISEGNVYEKVGFSLISENEFGYFYINSKTGERKHRYSLRKDKIDDNSGRTADEILLEKYWLKCYNLGNLKYELKIF